jgi:hypothetical protein
MLRYLKIGIPLLLVLAFFLFLHKNLPRAAVVQITGTDVKRVDQKAAKPKADPKNNKNVNIITTADVRFINAISKKGKPMVFRNEDTGWGWPPYFKFNSADLTAKAQAYSLSAEKVWVLVKYYDWRIHIFSMFPNALSLKEVNENYTHLPLFNITFFSALILLGFFLRRKLKKIFDWLRGS